MNKRLHTKWGNIYLHNEYYIFSGGKFKRKFYHVHVWEQQWGKLPKNWIVHHLDGNKQNNCLLNLYGMPKQDHIKLHHIGSKRSDESRQKMRDNHYMCNGGEHPRGMLGKHHSNKTKERLHEVLTKKYARLIKGGKNKKGKTKYVLKFNGKAIKYSITPQKLIDWFLHEYPLEIISTALPKGDD